MSEKREISEERRDELAHPASAPGFEPSGDKRQPPRQSGERRYERTLEEEEDTDDPESVDETAAPVRASSERVKNYVAYTIKLPSDQLSALQSIWLELKKLYGTHSPDKSGMIQAAIDSWLKRWDGPDRDKLLEELLDIRQSTRRRQYRKGKN